MLAIGLMSGTSLDGIDAALIETDGEGEVRPVAFVGSPYSDEDRAALSAATELALLFNDPGEHPLIERAETLLTQTHAAAVAALLEQAGVEARTVDVIGFHGQTVAHRPDKGWTWQLGDGAVTWRLIVAAAQAGQVCGSGSAIFCRRSNAWPQVVHWKP